GGVERRHAAERAAIRHHVIGDADIAAAARRAAHGADAHAVDGFLGLDRRRDIGAEQNVALGVERIRLRQIAVQIGQMLRIDIALMTLKPVAFVVQLGGPDMGRVEGEKFVSRLARRRALAEIGEDQPARLETWIGRVADAVLERGALARLFETAPVPRQKPAVIDAAQPAILDPAIAEIDQAMRAVPAAELWSAP